MDGGFLRDMTDAKAFFPDKGEGSQKGVFKHGSDLHRPREAASFRAVPVRAMATDLQAEKEASEAAANADVTRSADGDACDLGPQPHSTPDAPAMIDTSPTALRPGMNVTIVPTTQQLEDARAEGFAEGRAAALAELDRERHAVAMAAAAFASALEKLANPPAAQVAALSTALDQAVARLAAERAGQAIDTDPAPFARRIAGLAARVSGGLGDVMLHLHPEDLEVVAPVFAQTCSKELANLAQARLVADPALSRGDIDLRTASLRIEDLIRAAAPASTDLHDAG